MARTSSQTAAVLTAASAAGTPGMGNRMIKVRRGVRGVGLAVYPLVRNALIGTRPGAMAVTAAMAAGGALLAIGLITGHSGAQAFGAFLVLGGLGAAAPRGKWLPAAVVLVVAGSLALLPRIVVEIADSEDADDALTTFEGAWILVVLVVAAVVLGSLSIVWPREDRRTKA